MYILFIVLIVIAAALLVITVLAQSPKGGMAANFGASNQVMGVRQTADFLEKFTWGLSIAIVIFSLCATMAMPSDSITKSNDQLQNKIIKNTEVDKNVTPFQVPTQEAPSESTPTQETPENNTPAQ